MIGISLIDYRKIEKFSIYLYLALIAVLIYTLIFGRYVNGARSWIGIGSFGIQPSEFGKIFYILFFATYLDKSEKTDELKRFIVEIGRASCRERELRLVEGCVYVVARNCIQCYIF